MAELETVAPVIVMTESKQEPIIWTSFQKKAALSMNLPQFRKDNWENWSRMALATLETAGLDQIVLGHQQQPSIDDRESYGDYRDMSRQAKTKLLESIPEEFRIDYMDLKTPTELWSKLREQFAIKSPNMFLQATEDLDKLKLSDDGDFDIHVAKFNAAFSKMDRVRSEITKDDEQRVRFIRSLPTNVWGTFLEGQAGSTISTTYAELIALAREHSRKVNQHQPRFPHQANYATKPKLPYTSGATCDYCWRQHHTRQQCFTKTRDAEAGINIPHRPKPTISNGQSSQHASSTSTTPIGKPEFDKNLQPSRPKPSFANIAVALHATRSTTPSWIIDTGANVSISPDKKDFTNFSATEDIPIFSVNDEESISAIGIGDVKFTDPSGHDFILCDVLYAPKSPVHILSIAAACEQGLKPSFDNAGQSITLQKGSFSCTAHKDLYSNLYTIQGMRQRTSNSRFQFQAFHAQANITPISPEIWHKRLAHTGTSTLRTLGLAGHFKSSQCETCIVSKLPQSPYGAPEPVSQKGERIYTDGFGPLYLQDGTTCLFITFKDEITGYSWAFPINARNSHASRTAFITVMKEAELHANCKIKRIRSDEGTEYLGEMNHALKELGIIHEKSAAYAKSSNGMAERENRTLLDMMRSILNQANMPFEGFWELALEAAVYIKNRLPSATRNNTIPYETWTGQTSSINHIRPFGCIIYCHLSDEQRQTKAVNKAIKCCLVGYKSNNMYLAYDPRTGKTRLSRHHRIQEDRFFDPSVFANGLYPNKHIPDTIGGNYSFETLDSDTEFDDPVNDTLDSTFDDTTEPEPTPQPTQSPQMPHQEHMEQPQLLLQDAELDAAHRETEPEQSEPPAAHVEPTPEEQTTSVTTERRSTRSRNPSLVAREAAETTRSNSRRKRTIYLIKAHYSDPDPKTFDQAINSPDSEQWLAAIKDEINQINKLDAWTLCEVPDNQKLVGSRWVFKKKDDGRYRARLVAKGYTQIEGLDYDQVYAPVMAIETFRIILALAAAWGLHLIGADVKTAYLNGELDVEIFMEIPDGILKVLLQNNSNRRTRRLALKLRKALYGLKQSGHAWYHKLRQLLLKLGFTQTRLDPCLYLDPQGQILIAVYVDDILFAGANKQRIYEVYQLLALDLDIKMLGEVDTFLGIQIIRDNNGICINQQRKIDNLINRLDLTNAYPKKTSLNPDVSIQRFRDDIDEPADIQAYQQLIGSLQHLSVCTRPDITYAVVKLSHHLQKPATVHLEQAIHVLLYLKGTKNLSICYSSLESLHGYCDSSYMGDIDDSKSIEGYIYFLNGGAISWKSRKQNNLAMSTVEAEYMALSTAICEATHLRQKIAELQQTSEEQTLILCDANGSITLAHKETIGHKVKHIRLRYHHVRDDINEGLIKVEFVPGREMAADIFTKALATTLHQHAVQLLRMADVVGQPDQ
jgi:transposase InsO family protein